MIVERISANAFMSHDDTSVDLPPSGVVTIRGANGMGKSALAEAASMAVWGKPLRGASPWREGAPGSARVHAAAFDAVRSRSRAGRTALAWAPRGSEPTAWESTTKAQEALERLAGPWEAWRRTHVFSSSDGAHFTGATDAERKRLLEELVGLEGFDRALGCVREQRSAASLAADRLAGQVALLASRMTDARHRAADAEALLAAQPEAQQEPPGARSRAGDLRAMIGEAEAKLRGLGSAGAQAEAAASEAERRLRTLAGHACPTCEQPIPAGLLRSLEGAAQAERARAAEERRCARAAAERLESQLGGMAGELQSIRGVLARVEAAQAAGAARASATRQVEQAMASAAALEGDLRSARREVELRLQEWDELEGAEQVLGVRGARSILLSRALGGLEACANAWLARVCDGVRVRLAGTTGRKDGGVADAISLQVEGYGAGGGYAACSGGQRRRLDVAFLFALAEVASAARGQDAGTCWVDEALDALDQEGVERVVSAVETMAEHRTVVVISHNPGVLQNMRAVLTLQVERGKVSTL